MCKTINLQESKAKEIFLVYEIREALVHSEKTGVDLHDENGTHIVETGRLAFKEETMTAAKSLMN